MLNLVHFTAGLRAAGAQEATPSLREATVFKQEI